MNKEMRDFVIRELGCIVCSEIGEGYVPAEKHHMLVTGLHGNGKRRGERATVGLCAYHHRNVPVSGYDELGSAFWLGPSYAGNASAFRERWPDDWLLDRQNRLLREYADRTIGVTYEQLGV